MKTDYRVRDFKVSDLVNCWEVSFDLWGPTIANKILYEMTDKFDSPSGWPPHFVVVEYKGKIVGFAGYRRALIMTDAWEMIWNNVSKEHQRKGLGSLMAAYRVDKIKELGGKIIFTMTKYPPMPGSVGFETVSVIDGWHLMVNKLGAVDIS